VQGGEEDGAAGGDHRGARSGRRVLNPAKRWAMGVHDAGFSMRLRPAETVRHGERDDGRQGLADLARQGAGRGRHQQGQPGQRQRRHNPIQGLLDLAASGFLNILPCNF
jgi:hypothetical protein